MSWSYSKGTQLSGVRSLRKRKVVVIQEIEPKVRFLILQDLYTYCRGSFKAPLELKHVLGNPITVILGMTKTKYNNPRDSSYYYC